ncbi:RNA-metabolising metallo-beta-lactamase family protein [Zea mays]|uniref:RNA-metabolising metallo-beta-lactamase family protein n=1 Tax=Zea mays TaxID=4577 RepID=A0A1D6JBF9_MAIZE|nr:RNA-metabolising metallo-beta-lactamase family protein [Zea mays]
MERRPHPLPWMCVLGSIEILFSRHCPIWVS